MNLRHYIDFKLYLMRPADGQGACQVTLLPTPEVGETISPVTVPADNVPSQEVLAQLAGKSITLRQLAGLGKQLAHCLLPEGPIRTLFVEALKRAGNEGGVRLRLIIADYDLQQWPWEYTYVDPLGGPDSMRGFLALDPRVSLVRHEPLPHPHPEVGRADAELTTLRLVLAAALPKGQRVLQLDQEIANVTNAVQDFEVDGVRLTYEPVLRDATYDDLVQALRGPNAAYIFHFAGHGITATSSDWFNRGAPKEAGYLLLVEDKVSQQERRLSADDLGKLLQAAGVRLAVLGACHSGVRHARYPWDSVAGALAARDIPAIVAMQYEVLDAQAIEFSKAFYGTLAAGLSLDEAMAVGRMAMLQSTSGALDQPVNVEWGVPVLYSRLPDGRVFPGRMQRAGAAAAEFRKVINQTIKVVAEGGRATAVRVRLVAGTVKIEQNVDVVERGAEAVALEADIISGDINAHQNLGTVKGNATAVKVDTL